MEFEKLTQIIAEVLSVDPNEISESTTFINDLGADSLDVYQMVIALESFYNICISHDDIVHIRTVGEAARYLKRAVKQTQQSN